MWKVRIKIVPVIIGALETIKKRLDQNLQLLPGHPLAIELQKITLVSTANIICQGAGVNRFVLLFRSEFTRRPPPNN